MRTISEPPISGEPEKSLATKRRQDPPSGRVWNSLTGLWQRKSTIIAAISITAILLHLILRFGLRASLSTYQIPLLVTLTLGSPPLLYDLLRKFVKREFGSDLLGGISIVTSVFLGEYLAGSIIVLMLSGGESLESYALSSASSVLAALAKRMPSIAHRKQESEIVSVELQEVLVGDTLVVYPHDICPVDGVVIEGHGVMDESYLTGEPFQITKTSGSTVISGAINGESALTIRATQRAGRFTVRQDHGSHARVRIQPAPAPTARGPPGRDLYSHRTDCRPPGLGHEWRIGSLPGRVGNRDALSTATRDPHRHHRLDFPLRSPGDYRQEPGGAGTDR